MDKNSPNKNSVRISKYSLDSKASIYRQYAIREKFSVGNTIPIPTLSDLLALKKELYSLSKAAASKASQLEIDKHLISFTETQFAYKTAPSTPKPVGKIGSKNLPNPEAMSRKEKPEIKVSVEKVEGFRELHTPQSRSQKSTPPILPEPKPKRRRKAGTREDSDISDNDKDNPTTTTSTPQKTRSNEPPSIIARPIRSTSPYVHAPETTSRNSTPKPSKKPGKSPTHFLKKKMNSDILEEAKKSARGSHDKDTEEDYPTSKITNQIPIQTYWNYIESFFRPITEQDISFLAEKGDESEPYIIPPLGKHYLDVWTEEEAKLVPRFDDIHPTSIKLNSKNIPKNEDASVENLECGPFTERIVCALLQENSINSGDWMEDEDSESNTEDTLQSDAFPTQLVNMEERLKMELRYIGILGDEDINWKSREDDEISSTLRTMQKELRDQSKTNLFRKEKLSAISIENLAYQEYLQILEELDKQVEQSYIKRVRAAKSKKKKQVQPKALSENTTNIMERRQRYVEGIGCIFRESQYKVADQSIYEEVMPSTAETEPRTENHVP
ncbi:Transcriptional regulator [Basidiobolus ranarum]|uniref:Transcriptional regulator n=1 Tax=Basidiobolus ranarum TaxID=34480 RepID=A0ABR2WPQ7_9FUNG